jgi:hypothetical protein
MSNSAANLYDLINVAQGQIDNIAAVEYPAAGLTLTRSSTLAITTAGTFVTWQVETRGYAITWSGSAITIPSSGYYQFTIIYNSTVAHTVFGAVFVNSVLTGLGISSFNLDTRKALTITRYFTTGDSVQIALVPSVNTTISVAAENTANESPFLHVVQLTGSIES